MATSNTALFLKNFEEKAEFNQYWYSQITIDRIVEEVVRMGGRVGFLSTPSLYFALPESVREHCYVFDVSCFVPLKSTPYRCVTWAAIDYSDRRSMEG
jgi:hypothetical protein